jgi:branched-chain amino acid transport system substrate-binding protein
MRRREVLRLLGASAVVVPGAAVLGCHGRKTVVEERRERAMAGEGDIVIGAAWPWKRRKQLLYRSGLMFAVERLNAAGGVLGRRCRIIFEDDDESVDTGRLVAQRFSANPDVAAVLGHLQSYVSEPAAAIYDTAGLVMVSPTSTGPSLTNQGYRRVFRTIFTDVETGYQMAKYAAQRGYRRLAVCYVRSPYGREVANAFEERASELGLGVLARQSLDVNVEIAARNNALLLSDWRGRELDAVFIASDGAAAAALIAAARNGGITAPVLGADSMGTPDLFVAGAEAVEGTVIAAPFHADEPREEVRRFVKEFSARYGVTPDASAALAYDAVRVLAHAITAAGTPLADRVADALRSIRAWPGVTGPFTFTAQGDLLERTIIKVVARNGRLEHLKDGRA